VHHVVKERDVYASRRHVSHQQQLHLARAELGDVDLAGSLVHLAVHVGRLEALPLQQPRQELDVVPRGCTTQGARQQGGRAV
jgi:hypothetical protein